MESNSIPTHSTPTKQTWPDFYGGFSLTIELLPRRPTLIGVYSLFNSPTVQPSRLQMPITKVHRSNVTTLCKHHMVLHSMICKAPSQDWRLGREEDGFSHSIKML